MRRKTERKIVYRISWTHAKVKRKTRKAKRRVSNFDTQGFAFYAQTWTISDLHDKKQGPCSAVLPTDYPKEKARIVANSFLDDKTAQKAYASLDLERGDAFLIDYIGRRDPVAFSMYAIIQAEMPVLRPSEIMKRRKANGSQNVRHREKCIFFSIKFVRQFKLICKLICGKLSDNKTLSRHHPTTCVIWKRHYRKRREKLLKLHGINDVMTDTGYDDRPIDEQRRSIEDMYALIGRPVPAYWREKLWN